MLSNASNWFVEPLCEALHDTNAATRIGVAHSLERMQARASSAGPALVQALCRPEVAPSAARALGEIAYPVCVGELARRTRKEFDPALRVAAAQALGRINLPAGIEPLRALLAEDEPIRMRLTAAKSRFELDRGIDAAPFLIECMMSNAAEAVTAETTLFAWLDQRGKSGNRIADEIARAWHPPKAGLPPDPRDADRVEHEQRIERATLLRKELDELRE